MSFTLRQLELFTALTEFNTLSAAAAHLHISESALSHALTELEKTAGEPLLVRRKARGYVLTPAGEYFAERAQELLKNAAELGDALSNRKGELRGPVALGCFTGLGPTVLPPLFEHFSRHHPEVQLQVSLGTQDEIVTQLHQRNIDAAFLYDIDLPPGLRQEPLYETEVVAVLPEGHRLAERQSVALEDLVAEPLIMLDSIPSTPHTHRIFRELGLTPNVLAALPSIEMVRGLVARGLGYSLLMARPYSTVTTEDGRKVLARPLKPRSGVTNTVVAWPQEYALTARARAVIDHGIAEFGA